MTAPRDRVRLECQGLREHSLKGDIEDAIEILERVRQTIEKRVISQRKVIDLILAVLLSGRHGLLVWPPGVANTRLKETLGIALGVGMQRFQFTRDLMPADSLEAEVLEETPGGGHAFRFIKGPLFTQFLMVNEIKLCSTLLHCARKLLFESIQTEDGLLAGPPAVNFPIETELLRHLLSADSKSLKQKCRVPLHGARIHHP